MVAEIQVKSMLNKHKKRDRHCEERRRFLRFARNSPKQSHTLKRNFWHLKESRTINKT